MQKVEAYIDDLGRLYKTKREAVVAEFIAKMQHAWGTMPDVRDRGDAVVIARVLANNPQTVDLVLEAIWFLKKFDEEN